MGRKEVSGTFRDGGGFRFIVADRDREEREVGVLRVRVSRRQV